MTTKETTKRTPSPETLRKRTSNAYIDAMAATAKARVDLFSAHARYVEAARAEEDARSACANAELPVGNPPATLELTEPKP